MVGDSITTLYPDIAVLTRLDLTGHATTRIHFLARSRVLNQLSHPGHFRITNDRVDQAL